MQAENSGFTIIELIVVIAIVGVLAGIVFSVATPYLSRSRDVSVKANIAQVVKELQIHYSREGSYGSFVTPAIIHPCNQDFTVHTEGDNFAVFSRLCGSQEYWCRDSAGREGALAGAPSGVDCTPPVCVPSCSGLACGGDGCGGSCGECAPGSSCVLGSCQPDTNCGNLVCDGGEDCNSCPGDCGTCGPMCGNAVCEAEENCASCSADCGTCGPVCGNMSCETGEDCSSCTMDCGVCNPTCGDGICNGTESCLSCSIDCGPCE